MAQFSPEVEWVREMLGTEGYKFDTPEEIHRVVLAANCGVCKIGEGDGRHELVDEQFSKTIRTPVMLK